MSKSFNDDRSKYQFSKDRRAVSRQVKQRIKSHEEKDQLDYDDDDIEDQYGNIIRNVRRRN